METLVAMEGGDNAKENVQIDHYKEFLNIRERYNEEERGEVAETKREQDEITHKDFTDITLPSEGSKNHGKFIDGQPLCQPCAWFYKESGCGNKTACRYCHLCPWGELKNRKKQKIQLLRSQTSGEIIGGKTPPASTANVSPPPMFEPLRRTQSLPTEPLKIKAPICKPPPGLEMMMAPESPVADANNADPGGGGVSDMAESFQWDNNGERSAMEFEPFSEGSRQHGQQGPDGQQLCQPCVWYNKDTGCNKGSACRYCHLCPQAELKNRKKLKSARIHSEEINPPPAYPGEIKHSMSQPVKPTKDTHDGSHLPWMYPPPGHHGHYELNPYAANWPSSPWLDLQMPYSPGFDALSFQMGMQAMLGSMNGMTIPPLVSSILPEAGVLPNMADLPSAIPLGGAVPPPPPSHMPDIPTAVKKEDDGEPPAPEDSPRGVDASEKNDVNRLDPQALVWQTPIEDTLMSPMEFYKPPGLSLEGCDRSEPARIKTWPTCANDVNLQRAASQASVHTEEIPNGGGFRVSWMVDSKKLKGSDKVAVSPPFKIPTTTGTFRMMLVPSAQHERKGGGSFKKAKGRGIVQVKCEDDLVETGDSTVILRISVRGSGESLFGLGEDLPRGPIEHNFALGGIFGLPREQEVWDFQKHVDASQAFVVCLEILSPDRSTWPSDIALTPFDASAPAMINTSTISCPLNGDEQDKTKGSDPFATKVGGGKEEPMEITQNDCSYKITP